MKKVEKKVTARLNNDDSRDPTPEPISSNRILTTGRDSKRSQNLRSNRSVDTQLNAYYHHMYVNKRFWEDGLEPFHEAVQMASDMIDEEILHKANAEIMWQELQPYMGKYISCNI